MGIALASCSKADCRGGEADGGGDGDEGQFCTACSEDQTKSLERLKEP